MLILAFESSCDETACAVVKDGTQVLSNAIYSQIQTHQKTQGVVPEVAAREHVAKLQPVFDAALQEAGVSMEDVDAIACSTYPGLVNCILTSNTMASCLALIYKKPLIPVNHKLGHVLSCRLDADFEFKFPVVCLSVSGGHNELYWLHSFDNIELLGQSLDDAAGEAYDKVAKMLGLKYPGGPEISRTAESGDANKYKLPNPLAKQAFNFSFSGLKTNVKYLIEKLCNQDGLDLAQIAPDVAASFQQTINYNLGSKLVNAAKEFNATHVHLVGGVSANKDLRAQISKMLPANMTFKHPKKLSYCTDNAAMIAAAAYFVSKPEYIQAGQALTPGNY